MAENNPLIAKRVSHILGKAEGEREKPHRARKSFFLAMIQIL
jgi:hypothetical protein